ncbi:unnamed protein product [Boreogadus saida]
MKSEDHSMKLQSILESMLNLRSLRRKKSRCLAVFVMASVCSVLEGDHQRPGPQKAPKLLHAEKALRFQTPSIFCLALMVVCVPTRAVVRELQCEVPGPHPPTEEPPRCSPTGLPAPQLPDDDDEDLPPRPANTWCWAPPRPLVPELHPDLQLCSGLTRPIDHQMRAAI